MNSYFGDWYRSAGIPPEGIPLAERWKGVESFEPDAGDIALLTQTFYQLNLSDPSFSQRFRKAFNDADPNFPMSGNDRELIVLAGAELVDVTERGSRDFADLAGLCLVCGGAQNVRTAAVPQIPEIAAKYLGQRSVQRAKPEKDGKEEALSKAISAAGEPHSKLAPEFQKLQLEFPIVSEESNMLWWLISETSRDVKQRWSEIPLFGMVCTLTGKELADLTQIIPGPIAARAFLDRAIRSGRNEVPPSISIAHVVNDTTKSWRESHFSKPFPTGLEGILPISQAVTLSVQAPDDKAWQRIFKAATGIAATAKSNPDALAYQFYLEQLAARCFIKMKAST
jgi:hypothetical protein